MSHAINQQARQAALEAVSHLSVTPTSLVQYESRGKVAVIGGPEAAEFAPRIQHPLHAQVVLITGEDEPGVPLIAVGGRPIKVEGYLGAFKILLGEEGRPNAETISVDLILDLSPDPLLDMPVKPPGYLHSDTEESSLSAALLTLMSLTGSFEKPRYFDYDASICAHGRSGKTACTRCIDACPANAISSLAEAIEVDPYLCQGGGVCATVCPSGAIQYSYPEATDLLQRIRTLLNLYKEQGGIDPVIVFVAEADNELLGDETPNHLPVLVEELASVGLEVWLSCLAYGAQSVQLLDGGQIPATVTEAIQGQLLTAGEILLALGYPADAITLVSHADWPLQAFVSMPEIQSASYSGVGGKRQTAFLSIDHLHAQAPRPTPLTGLSVGAPFGMAQVEAKACTLCMSCVGVCPGKALQQGDGVPQLRFVEANCLQCGMCTRTCPEDAISISPRLLFDREARMQQRILHEEEPFCCVSCGKPFATRSVIDTMLQRLQGHWMFQNERSRERLMMCEDCRVIDAVQDSEAMQAGLDSPTRQ